MKVGQELVENYPELSVFYFGHADQPLKRDLVQVRKEVGWFKEESNAKSRLGLTGIGAIPYMSNFNVMIHCQDLKIGQEIAKSIRERNGGLLGVQAMAFSHGENQIEIACNVDLISDEDETRFAKGKGNLSRVFGQYFMTPFPVILDEIKKKTEEKGCKIVGDSVIIGFTPSEAGRITKECLKNGETWIVGQFKQAHHM